VRGIGLKCTAPSNNHAVNQRDEAKDPRQAGTQTASKLRHLVNVHVAKISWPAVAAQQLVEGVNIAHVIHSTEGEVVLNPFGIVHEVLGYLHEVEDIILGARLSSTKTIASKLCGPDGKVEGVM